MAPNIFNRFEIFQFKFRTTSCCFFDAGFLTIDVSFYYVFLMTRNMYLIIFCGLVLLCNMDIYIDIFDFLRSIYHHYRIIHKNRKFRYIFPIARSATYYRIIYLSSTYHTADLNKIHTHNNKSNYKLKSTMNKSLEKK